MSASSLQKHSAITIAGQHVFGAPVSDPVDRETFRQRSALLKELPFLTGVIQDARPLEYAIRFAILGHVVADQSAHDLVLDLACRFTQWEAHSKHTLPDSVSEESGMSEQNVGAVFSSLHEIVILSTLDRLLAHAVPTAQVRPLQPLPNLKQAISRPLPDKAIQILVNVFRAWSHEFNAWRISILRDQQNQPIRNQNVFALLPTTRSGASPDSRSQTVASNIVVAVLMIRFLATCPDAITEKGSEFHNSVRREMTTAAAKAGVELPPSDFCKPPAFFGRDKKPSNVFVAAFCAIFISPLCLFTEQRLYHTSKNLRIEYPFLLWKRIGYLERSPTITLLERKVFAFLVTLALDLEGKVNARDAVRQLAADCADVSVEQLKAVDEFYLGCANILLDRNSTATQTEAQAKPTRRKRSAKTSDAAPEHVAKRRRPESLEDEEPAIVKIKEEEYSDDDLEAEDAPFGLQLARPGSVPVNKLPESIVDYAGAFEISAWGARSGVVNADIQHSPLPSPDGVHSWTVQVSLPKSMQVSGSTSMKAIDTNFQNLDLSRGTPWIDIKSAEQWSKVALADIENQLARRRYVFVHGTDVGKGWHFDMASALRIHPAYAYAPVNAQDFSNHAGDGHASLRRVSLSIVVDPEHRDFNTVLNVSNILQERSQVCIPRQRELDVGEHALRCRREVLADWSGAEEASLEKTLASAFNWGTISQQHAISFETINTAGVSSSMAVMAGQLIVSIHKSTYDGGDSRFNHLDWFVDLQTGQPGGNDDGNWITLVLSPGDIIILPPGARFATWTLMDAMVTGLHFYSHVSLKSSLCCYVGALFSAQFADSAGHIEFLSPMQAFSTLWLPSFSSEHRSIMSKSDVAILTAPDPTQPGGLDILLALAVVLVFNDALSAKTRPYRGVYYVHDAQSFAFIWRVVSRTGDIICEDLNAPQTSADQQHGDYPSFAGLAPLLFHVARALVCYAAKWAKLRRQGGIRTAASNSTTLPTSVYARVVEGLRSALSMPAGAVEDVLGNIDACVALKTTTLFPVTTWMPREKGAEQPDSKLWPNLGTLDTAVDGIGDNYNQQNTDV